jgi:molybdenum cofactor biosynthesis protein B
VEKNHFGMNSRYITMSTREHKKSAPKQIKIGILSISTTRTLKNDESGNWIRQQAVEEGNEVVFHQVVADDRTAIAKTIQEVIQNHAPQALLLTGGTGVSSKDVTIEAVRPMFSKELTAFGMLFTQLSYQQIGSAALLSRATAGVVENTVLFCMPGSLKACQLACKALIFPELRHLAKHLQEG